MQSSLKKPLTVTVIIPTYNRAHLVRDAIDSALGQTRRPLEILVIDDGSTDDTQEVLAGYGSPVHVIRQTNRGRSAARNAGLRAAKGDAVILLDSDDVLLPNAIADCVSVLESHPEVDVVYGDAELVEMNGRLLSLYSDRLGSRPPSGDILGELGRRCCLTISGMVRRSALNGIFFEEGMEFGEDYDFWRQLAAHSQFAYVDVPVSRYRFHSAMTIASDPTRNLDAELAIQCRVLDMPEFARVSRRDRARAYASHGAKQAMRGRKRVVRSMLWRALRTDPTYTTTYALLGLSLFSLRPLQYAISKRRRLTGNHIAADAGEAAVARLKDRPEKNASADESGELATVGSGQESFYG